MATAETDREIKLDDDGEEEPAAPPSPGANGASEEEPPAAGDTAAAAPTAGDSAAAAADAPPAGDGANVSAGGEAWDAAGAAGEDAGDDVSAVWFDKEVFNDPNFDAAKYVRELGDYVRTSFAPHTNQKKKKKTLEPLLFSFSPGAACSKHPGHHVPCDN